VHIRICARTFMLTNSSLPCNISRQ
jgi:hypothetical protein